MREKDAVYTPRSCLCKVYLNVHPTRESRPHGAVQQPQQSVSQRAFAQTTPPAAVCSFAPASVSTSAVVNEALEWKKRYAVADQAFASAIVARYDEEMAMKKRSWLMPSSKSDGVSWPWQFENLCCSHRPLDSCHQGFAGTRWLGGGRLTMLCHPPPPY